MVMRNVLISFVLLFLPAHSEAQVGEDPAVILRSVIDDIETLWVPLNRDPDASYDSRRKWTINLVDSRFDIKQMTTASLGTRWRTLTEAQQADYAPLFREILIETVIDWMDGYDGEQFDVTRVREAGRNTEIQTLFVESNGRKVRLTWVTRRNDGRYQFRDVRFSGISLVADFRGGYQFVLDREGFDGLVLRLERDIANLRAKQS